MTLNELSNQISSQKVFTLEKKIFNKGKLTKTSINRVLSTSF